MELLDFIKSIGGHIAFRSCMDPDTMLVEVARDSQTLHRHPYPGGSQSLCVWVGIKNGDLNAAYEEGLTDLADTMSGQPKVGFNRDQLYDAPELTHTPGYRPKAKKKAKVSS